MSRAVFNGSYAQPNTLVSGDLAGVWHSGLQMMIVCLVLNRCEQHGEDVRCLYLTPRPVEGENDRLPVITFLVEEGLYPLFKRDDA